jgi:hypothetical protein
VENTCVLGYVANECLKWGTLNDFVTNEIVQIGALNFFLKSCLSELALKCCMSFECDRPMRKTCKL